MRSASPPQEVRPVRLGAWSGAGLILAFVITACGDGQGFLVPDDANLSRGMPANQHCEDHQSAVKVEVPSGWSFAEGGPYIETVYAEDSRIGEEIAVQVTIDGGTVSFASDDPDLELEEASFCIKAGPNQTGSLTGLSGNTDDIPNRGGQAPDVSYVSLNGVTSIEPTEDTLVEQCGAALSVSGGFEIYEAYIEMGTTSGEFLFEYTALNQPDWYEIWYEGERIVNLFTGTRANDPFYDPLFESGGRLEGAVDAEREAVYSGQRWVTFGDESSTSTRVFLRVTGSEPGTVWHATLNCPSS
jgi:hypothetical protein